MTESNEISVLDHILERLTNLDIKMDEILDQKNQNDFIDIIKHKSSAPHDYNNYTHVLKQHFIEGNNKSLNNFGKAMANFIGEGNQNMKKGNEFQFMRALIIHAFLHIYCVEHNDEYWKTFENIILDGYNNSEPTYKIHNFTYFWYDDYLINKLFRDKDYQDILNNYIKKMKIDTNKSTSVTGKIYTDK